MAFHVTRCPGCDSTFNTNPAVLAAAAGRVRCGACLTVFEAVDNFVAPDPALQEEDGGSVFVSNDPADYFDPSRFLTRRALQEPPRQEESTTPTDLPSELPGPDTLSVPSPVAAAPEVDWDMGTSGQSGPQFTFSADTATELPGDPERFQDSTDFFAAIEQGLPEQQTDLPEDFDSVDAAPPWMDEEVADLSTGQVEFVGPEAGDGSWSSTEPVSALPWTPPAITAPVSEFDEQDNDPPIDFTAPLEPSYETSSDESILAAQEDFFSITPEPPSADQSAISSLAPQPENEFEESNGDTVIEPDPAAMDAAPFEVLDPEPSDDEIRARALRAQFEDEGALESLPPENLSVLGKFANTLELPLGVRRNWGRNIALSLLALILGGLLAAQYLWRYQSLFAQDPLLRPLYQLACNSLGCQLPAYQDIASIVSDGLTVRSHPQRDNALVANITFQNAAPFPQPFPIMILSFNSATNSVIALREFSPDEYLPPQLQDFALMPSLTPIQLSLELIDPGPDAVNYTLAFRRP